MSSSLGMDELPALPHISAEFNLNEHTDTMKNKMAALITKMTAANRLAYYNFGPLASALNQQLTYLTDVTVDCRSLVNSILAGQLKHIRNTINTLPPLAPRDEDGHAAFNEAMDAQSPSSPRTTKFDHLPTEIKTII